MPLADSKEALRYRAQISLPAFGVEAQQRVARSSVLVVGVGGIGCPLALYLVSSGIGRIGLVDSDEVELTNLHRQVLYGESDLTRPKVEVAAERLAALRESVEIVPHKTRLSTENVLALIEGYDLIIDGSDNFGTRYLLSDACCLAGKPLLAASVFQMEGQVGFYNVPLKNGERSATYRDLYPDPPASKEALPCSESGVLGPVPGVLGTLLANEALRFLGKRELEMAGSFAAIDFKKLGLTRFVLERSSERHAGESALLPQESYDAYSLQCGIDEEEAGEIESVTVQELKKRMDDRPELPIIDVREPFERELASIGGDLIPLKELVERASEIPREEEVVVYCRSGKRSEEAIKMLREQFGFTNLVNLEGGILAWADEIDPTLTKY